jgi:predicted CXXCH cytochrome family protein
MPFQRLHFGDSAFLVIFCTMLMLVVGCNKSSPTPSLPTPKTMPTRVISTFDAELVGSAKCAECHAEISEMYNATHSMAQAMAYAGSEIEVEDYSNGLFSPPGNRSYKVEKTDQSILHHEIMFDRSGEQIFDQSEKIAYVLGSGRRGRSYLIDRDGLLFQSPIGWYSQKHVWALSPGYDHDNHQRFDRRIRSECIFCHAGRVSLVDPGLDRFAKRGVVEVGISCERCHGPGKQHVAIYSAGQQGGDTIVNPAKLAPSARDSVCYQCHVRGEFQFEQQGRNFAEYHIGDNYADQWATFVSETSIGDPETLVAQFRSSQCFLKSDGRLGCISCHDAHSRPKPEDMDQFYRAKCMNCHNDNGCSLAEEQRLAPPATGSCIQCHMPAMPSQEIPHTALINHGIPRNAPISSKALTNEKPSTKQRLSLFMQDEMPESAVKRANGIVSAISATEESNPGLARKSLDLLGLNLESPDAIISQIGDDMPVLQRVGIPFAMLGRTDVAEKIWARGLELEPTNDVILDSLARYYIYTQDLARSLQYFDLLIKDNPHLAELHWLRSRILERQGNLTEAIRAVEKSLEANPTALPARIWLIDALNRAGRPDESQRQLEIVKRMRGS